MSRKAWQKHRPTQWRYRGNTDWDMMATLAHLNNRFGALIRTPRTPEVDRAVDKVSGQIQFLSFRLSDLRRHDRQHS